MLKGFQKKYLRGLVHKKKPVVFIGQKGLTPSVFKSLEEALFAHEVIKIKCIEFKEKSEKAAIAEKIEKAFQCNIVGTIGHNIIVYRPCPDLKNRKIRLPERKHSDG